MHTAIVASQATIGYRLEALTIEAGMLKAGDYVEGTICSVHHFGAFLNAGADRIFVMTPDLGKPPTLPTDLFKVGDKLKVKIVLFSAADKMYRGTVNEIPHEQQGR